MGKVVGMKLTKFGSVDFDHTSVCDILGSDRIFLCFNTDDNINQRCGIASTPLGPFNPTEKLLKIHINSKIATSECKLEIVQMFMSRYRSFAFSYC